MREYLVFQLYGPMASWGDIAVGETRPSAFIPSKSAILGLIAAALGIKRPDTVCTVEERRELEDTHNRIACGYGMAVRVNMLGAPLQDYHTSEVPHGSGYATRRDEIQAILCQKKSGVQFKGTILSQREYRQDAFCAVAIWERLESPYALHDLKNLLLEPGFTLYLGRKSCPLALPLNPKVVSEKNIEEALALVSFPPEPNNCFERFLREQPERPLFVWDVDADTALRKEQTVQRRDNILSRQRWQFEVRSEHQGYLPEGGQP